MKGLLKNVTVLVGVLFFAFGLGEFAIRMTVKSCVVLMPRYQTDYRYGKYTLRGLRPNMDFWHTSADGSWEFITNNHGFRNTEDFSYTKPPGVLRVLAQGDSHTEGYEVKQNETFSAVLQRYLMAHGYAAQLLNTGVSGFSTAEEDAFLENEGIRYNPDVVVLAFFANDFEDNFKAGLFELNKGGRLVAKKYKHIPGVRIQNFIYAIPGVQWLSENSYFYSLLFNDVWNYYKRRLAERAMARAKSDSRRAAVALAAAPEYAVATEARHPPAELDLAFAILKRIHRFCATRGIPLIVDIPAYVSAFKARPSMPADFRKRLSNGGFDLISSNSLIAPYNGAVSLHAPHGMHISPRSRTL